MAMRWRWPRTGWSPPGDGVVVAALLFGDEFRCTGDPGGAGPVLLRTVLLPKVQVGGNVAGEEDIFLGHISDDGAQIVHAVLRMLDTIHQNLPKSGS